MLRTQSQKKKKIHFILLLVDVVNNCASDDGQRRRCETKDESRESKKIKSAYYASSHQYGGIQCISLLPFEYEQGHSNRQTMVTAISRLDRPEERENNATTFLGEEKNHRELLVCDWSPML